MHSQCGNKGAGRKREADARSWLMVNKVYYLSAK